LCAAHATIGAMPNDTPAWVRDAIFYQVFPDRFAASDRVPKPGPLEPWDAPPTANGFKGGDLLGVVEHLDHIAGLGATALYLNPIFQSASNHRYHTYDYLRVDPLLGGDAALRELLDAAHDRGIRVVLDGVFNHTGRGFWPFHHVLETGGGSPYRRWFRFDDGRLDSGGAIDAYPAGNAAVWRGHARSELGYEAWWDIPALPKLNTDEPVVREYLFGVAEHWLRFGIDGWRLDVPGEIQDPDFWIEFRRRCRAVNPDAYLVGEVWDVDPAWVGGDRFDGLMNYPLAEAILGFVAGDSLDEPLLRTHEQYAKVERLDGAGFTARLDELMRAYDPTAIAAQLNVLGSHDTPRVLSILGGDRAALELAVVLQATLPGAPCVYYGDEIGLEGRLDPDSRRAFPWDPARWDHGILEATRAAFRVRAAEPVLRRGGIRFGDPSGRAIAFERVDDDARIAVGVNPGPEPARLTLARDARAGAEAEVIFRSGAPGSGSGVHINGNGLLDVELGGRSSVFVRVPGA
jgi:cyclomaltodextrinase